MCLCHIETEIFLRFLSVLWEEGQYQHSTIENKLRYLYASCVTTEEEWIEECSGCDWKPKLLCIQCKKIVETTSISNLQQGGGVGCTCHYAKANHCRDRRSEVVAIGKDRSFDVVTTEEEWVEKCSGRPWKPKLLCLECKEIVETTCITSLQQGRGVGCKLFDLTLKKTKRDHYSESNKKRKSSDAS